MTDSLFAEVDCYIDDLFAPTDAALEAALTKAREAGMPAIQISAGQGKLLYLLGRLIGARRILEIGTLAGYSTIWLGRALAGDGRLISLEVDPTHADVARANIAGAGLADRVDIRTGPALDSLRAIPSREPFDLVFIDADKGGYVDYLEEALRLTRPGGLVLGDNVIRAGKVVEGESGNPAVEGARRFNEALAAENRVEAIILQQVGVKGHDGLAIARVKD